MSIAVTNFRWIRSLILPFNYNDHKLTLINAQSIASLSQVQKRWADEAIGWLTKYFSAKRLAWTDNEITLQDAIHRANSFKDVVTVWAK